MKKHTIEAETIPIFDATTGAVQQVEKVRKTDAEWKKMLTPEQYRITRRKGTEQPFVAQCPIISKEESGIFRCVGCGTDLFTYEKKFESGTGWPSFWEPVSPLNITLKSDASLGMQRTEVLCSRCDAHLGHVFDDGPPPTGKRYCINLAALVFEKFSSPQHQTLETATFGAGCFWGVESSFQQVEGVVATAVGFMGGATKNPSYKAVCTDTTGHAEVVQLSYDPAIVSYEKLLDIFWHMHDPTTPNRQGPDTGSQYRSVIFYHTPEQQERALASKKKIEESKKLSQPIVTEITVATEFYPAEEYHQRYYQKRGMTPTCRIPQK